MQFPVKSLQGCGESPNRRGPVTTCTTSFCAASGGTVDRKLRLTVMLASPPSPRMAGRRPISGAHPQSSCHSTSFTAAGRPRLKHKASSAVTQDRRNSSIRTLTAMDVPRQGSGAPGTFGSLAASIYGRLLSELQSARPRFTRAVFHLEQRRIRPAPRSALMKIVRFSAMRRRKSSLVASNRVIMNVSVPVGERR